MLECKTTFFEGTFNQFSKIKQVHLANMNTIYKILKFLMPVFMFLDLTCFA